MHLVCPQKSCITIVSNFSWVLQSSQEKSKRMVMKFIIYFFCRRVGRDKQGTLRSKWKWWWRVYKAGILNTLMHHKCNLRSGDFFFLAGEKNTAYFFFPRQKKIAWSQVTKNEENRLNNRAGRYSHHSCWCFHFLFVVFIRLFCGFLFFLLLLLFFVFLSRSFPIICSKKPFPFLIQTRESKPKTKPKPTKFHEEFQNFPEQITVVFQDICI